MFKSKYSTFLTVLLIITIIIIVVIATIAITKIVKKYKDEKESKQAIAEFITSVEDNTNNKENTDVVPSENIMINQISVPESNTNITNNTNNTNNTTNVSPKKVKFYKEFVMIGYIEIPKTNIEYPILTETTAEALETSVGVLYPTNATLNTEGNVVIIGHNYRNGQFFSNNKKLSVGDKIKITDESGKKMTYTIYEIFETTPEDTEYITRDRGNNIEISLSTCTDDGSKRLIILARV